MQNRKKLTLALMALFIINILLIRIMSALPDARAETLRQGSSGDVVRQIQTKLKNWGYYYDVVDGIYGPKTVAAVKYFQSNNGLTADGMCGIRTQQAMGIYMSAAGAGTIQRNNDVELLARLISAESRGEPYSAQVAVGAVALNRVRHPSFPNSLSAVIYQPGAFSGLSDRRWNQPVTDEMRRAAQDAINGADPSFGAVYYFDPSEEPGSWMWSRPAVVTIGRYRFCK